MKKLLVLLFALVLCLGLVACNPGTPTTSSNGQDNLEKAAAYVSALYKSEEKDKPVVNTADYDLLNSATGNGESFFVTWEIKKINEDDLDVAVLKTKENGTPYVEITYNLEYNTVATNYQLIATISDGTNSIVKTFDRQVPAYAFTTYEEWLENCKAGNDTVMNIKAYVIGVITTGSSSGTSMYLQDAEGHGYYAYKPVLADEDKANDEALRAAFPVGCEVIVSGTGVVYSGQYEFNSGCTVKKTGNSIESISAINASEAFASATDNKDTALIPYQNILVTLENCTLTSIDGKYYYFTIGENKVKFNIYDNNYFMSSDDQKAWKENFKAGYTATITGIVSCFSNAYQIYPVSADVITNLTAPTSKTYAEMLALNPFSSTVIPVAGMTYNLPTAGSGDNTGVAIAWALDKAYDFVTLENGVLTFTALPADVTEVVLTATLSAEGEENQTKSFTLTANSANTVWTSIADAIAACQALDASSKEISKGWYYIKGVVADTPTETYCNFHFVDGDNMVVYGLYTLYADQRYGTKRDIAEIPFAMGDTVSIYCQLQNFNGTLEFVNARLLDVEKATVTPELKVNITKGELSAPATVTATGNIDLATAGTTYTDVTVAWALDAEYAFAKIENGKLVISALPATPTVLTLTATVTCEKVTDTVTLTVTVRKQYEAPAVNTPFVMALDQNKLGKTLYFAGKMNSFYYATTENILEATEVMIEAVEGGYRIYFMDGEDKTYLDIIRRDDTRVNVVLTTTPQATYVFDTTLGVFTANVVDRVWYLGTYDTKNTISASETYRISGDNAASVGVSQFVCYFTTKTITDDIKVNTEKAGITDTHMTEAGAIDLPAVGSSFTDVAISWSIDQSYDFATLADGKLTVTDLPMSETVITLTATLTCGEVTETVTMTVTVSGKTIEWTSIADALAACQALASGTTSEGWYYIRGTVGTVPTSDYANFNLSDGTNAILVYGVYTQDGTQAYGSKKQIAEIPFGALDTVELYGQLKNHNGTLEIVNARLLSYAVTEKTAEQKIAFEMGNLKAPASSITSSKTVNVATVGAGFADVTITWSSDNAAAVVDGGTITYTQPTDADATVTLTATFTCGEASKSVTFTVSVAKVSNAVSVAKYTTVLGSSSTTALTQLSTDQLNVIKATCVGSDIINSVTGEKMYVGQSGFESLGLKFGSSKANGSVTFKLNQSVTKVVIVVAGWTDTDTVSVNGGDAQTPGVKYSAEGSLQTLTFELTEATTEITITFAKRGFLQSIEFFA